MHSHFSQKIRYIEVFVVIAIFTVVSACGGATNGNIGQASSPANSHTNHTKTPNTVTTPKPTPTDTTTPTPEPTPTDTATPTSESTPTDSTASTPVDTRAASPPINSGSVSVDANGLHIQSASSISCPNYLVLATNRTSYSAEEFQQIGSYLDALSQTDETTTSINNIKLPLPTSLSWASGGAGCFTELEITNTSNNTIQIAQIAAHLTATPQRNNYQYRLINSCSFLSLEKCQCNYGKCQCNQCGGGGGGCSAYVANIQLGMGQQDSVFSTPPKGDTSCGQMTLTPNKTLDLSLSLSPSPDSTHLIYSLTTEFTLDTANGQQVLPLPQLGTSIAFADKNQFSCYGLQNQTLTKLPSDQYAKGVNCV